MKKIFHILIIFCALLTSCSNNEIYEHNKLILDNYNFNNNYAIVTNTGYESENKTINFKNVINKKLISDGKNVELIYNTRYQQTIVDDILYFCYEYKRNDDIGHHALGYVDINTLKVYVDYFDYERYMFDYNFSTDKFVCYTFKEDISDFNVIDIVFFKDTNKLEFDYDLSLLNYNQEDIEQPNLKDYYIEDGIKYDIDHYGRKLTNIVTNEVINLPYQNDLLELDTIVKEIYSSFEYESIAINATYFSNGEELFFYIHDRPTNKLNAPFMIFKCNVDLSNVEYIGYSEYLIQVLIKLG